LSALALAACVLALDIFAPVEAAVATLYALAIAAGGYGRGPKRIRAWTAACFVLATLSFLLTHLDRFDLDAVLRLIFAMVGMLLACLMLLAMERFSVSQSSLERAELNFRQFAELIPVGIWSHDPQTGASFMNERCRELTGASPEAMATDWKSCLHPDDAADWETSPPTHAGVWGATVRIGSRDRFRWVSLTHRSLRNDGSGERAGWIGAILDIDTEVRAKETIAELNRSLSDAVQRRTEELNRSEFRFASLFSDLDIPCAEQTISAAYAFVASARAAGHASLASWRESELGQVARCRDELRFTSANCPLLALVGCGDREALLAMPLAGWIKDAERFIDMQITAMFEGSRHLVAAATIVSKSGEHIPVALRLNMLADWSACFVTFTDTSEQQRAHELVLATQAQVARANRSATIGAMSASLVHELNQPILSVGLEAKNSKRWLAAIPSNIEAANDALDRLLLNADRMAAIVGRTREKLVKRQRALVAVNLCALAIETAALLERELTARGATLSLTFDSEFARVAGDPVELQQVLINLILNAADAMAGAGVPSLVGLRVGAGERGRIAVIVNDRGPGIPDDVAERLFEPFFTTKQDGMGMGLQICKTIVETLGGVIAASNRPDGGASFRFEIPAFEDID
jgi:C4-dicarboxylate-specific signal transduction histidine kinase